MSAVGLVLGGGGITGAAYETAALMALELATGWRPDSAEVVVGTSAGAFVAAMVRGGRLGLDSLVGDADTREEVAETLRTRIFRRKPGVKLGTWLRRGVLPGLRKPGLTLLLGSPAPFVADGLAEWVRTELGEVAERWPEEPTSIVAFDVAAHRRVAFGTVDAPSVPLADAVAASSAIPLVFRPYEIEGRPYVDGGVVSGTHADLVLGNPTPLDLVLVLAPMAVEEERDGSLFVERVFDRVGRSALADEVALINQRWPHTDVVVLRPKPQVLEAMRPNPMDPTAAVPSFIRTLLSMRRTLAEPEVWAMLRRHLVEEASRRRA